MPFAAFVRFCQSHPADQSHHEENQQLSLPTAALLSSPQIFSLPQGCKSVLEWKFVAGFLSNQSTGAFPSAVLETAFDGWFNNLI